jgi:hypothetical protein
MQTPQPLKQRRPCRPRLYDEPTVPIRVPAKLVGEVKALIRKAKRKLPLYVVGKLIKAL